MDAGGLRQIGVAVEPAGQLGVAHARRAGGEVALGEHVPDQHPILERAEQRLGLAPASLALEGEDVAVAGEVGRREPARQAPTGPGVGVLAAQRRHTLLQRAGGGGQEQDREAEREDAGAAHGATPSSWRRRAMRSRQASFFCSGWRRR